MIYRKFKDGEEISFCNVDTPDEALETMLDPYSTVDAEIIQAIKPTIYGWHATVNGTFWEIKGYASAEDKVPAQVRKIIYPIPEEFIGTDFEKILKQNNELVTLLKEIRKEVNSVNAFASNEEKRKQMDYTLNAINELLEKAGI